MEKKDNKKKKRIITAIVIIIIIILVLLLLKACGNGGKEIDSYTVKFVNSEGIVYQEEKVNVNEMPVYAGVDPTYEDDNYTYEFIGWDKKLEKVESDQTYVAIFEKVAKVIEKTKANPQVKEPTKVIGMVYNGEARKPVIKGKTSGGTLVYALGTAKGATGVYTEEIPYVTDAGTYYVWYKVIGNDEYNGTDPKSVCVTVAKKAQEVEAPATPTIEVENIVPSDTQLVTKVTLNSNTEVGGIGSLEYGINTENSLPKDDKWQTSVVFDNLDPVTTYYFFVRFKGDNNNKPSESSTGLEVTTCKANQDAPTAPVIKSIEYVPEDAKFTFTLETIETKGGGVIYCLYSSTWIASDVSEFETPAITGIEIGSDDTYVEFFAYFKGTDKYNQSAYSSKTKQEGYKSCCFAEGTKITMADGTYKNIEDIKLGDSVLTLNHETGLLEAQDICIVFKGESKTNPFTLYFDDGSKVSLTNMHYLFEKESLCYTPISERDAKDFIGKHFYSDDAKKYLELVDVVYETEVVEYYTLYTEENFNYFGNGMLNVSEDIVSYLNFYKFNEDLSVDMEALNKDIEKYGLCEYDESMPISEEEFIVWHGKYANIIIGKGLTTWEDIEKRNDEYLGIE